MRYARLMLVLAGLAVIGLAALSIEGGRAGAFAPFGDVPGTSPIATPVKVFRDCQEIALCNTCKPVYKCRSCTYQKTCSRGLCSWGDVCVWGPYVKVLPPGARIIRVR